MSYTQCDRKRDLLRILVSSLCEELLKESDQSLIFDLLFQKLPYANLEKDFVEIMSSKAKSSSLLEILFSASGRPQVNYYKLLHSFFIFRGDFRNGMNIYNKYLFGC